MEMNSKERLNNRESKSERLQAEGVLFCMKGDNPKYFLMASWVAEAPLPRNLKQVWV